MYLWSDNHVSSNTVRLAKIFICGPTTMLAVIQSDWLRYLFVVRQPCKQQYYQDCLRYLFVVRQPCKQQYCRFLNNFFGKYFVFCLAKLFFYYHFPLVPLTFVLPEQGLLVTQIRKRLVRRNVH
jgi:hypothetical protein